ncbi:MAG TPA: sugar porter family MFS transporter [Acidobacteriaceae bacterium]|nr:sugar porter family MFS transporter [Acidobacteriaceae bacterium]
MRLNYYLAKGSLVGALGGFLFGFDTAVISGTTQQLGEVFHLSSFNLGLTVSIAVIGAVIGAISSGELGQKIGPRQALRIMAMLYLLSSIGCAFAWNWPALVVFRFLGGLGIGGSSVLGPVYIAELAPAKWRGRLVGLFQINIVIGILLAYASNYVIAMVNSGSTQWRWQLGIASVPAALFLVLLFAIPRSSRWLVTQSRIDEARQVLQMMGSPNTEEELQEIIASIHLERSSRKEPLFQKKYRLPIFLAVTIGLFNQLSGINAILYYLPSIFNDAGFNKLSGDKQAVLVGAMNLVATLLAMSVIDKIGRKTLLLIGSVGTAFSLAGVAEIFHTQRGQSTLLWYLIGFIFFFAISQGAVIWVYLSEVFPTRVRSKGQSLGSSSHWIMNATLSLLFPIVAQHSNAAPFVFFAAMMALQFFIVLFVYPETKGITLEQMQHKLGIE